MPFRNSTDAHGWFMEAYGRFMEAYGRLTDSYGRFTEAYGRFTEAYRRFTVADGRLMDGFRMPAEDLQKLMEGSWRLPEDAYRRFAEA